MSIDAISSDETIDNFFTSNHSKWIHGIPLVNILLTPVSDYFHMEKMGKETDLGQIVKWIESKNECKMYNLVSNGGCALLTLALCITGVIYTIIPTIVFTALTLQTTKEITRNWQVIDRLNHPNDRLKPTVFILVD